MPAISPFRSSKYPLQKYTNGYTGAFTTSTARTGAMVATAACSAVRLVLCNFYGAGEATPSASFIGSAAIETTGGVPTATLFNGQATTTVAAGTFAASDLTTHAIAAGSSYRARVCLQTADSSQVPVTNAYIIEEVKQSLLTGTWPAQTAGAVNDAAATTLSAVTTLALPSSYVGCWIQFTSGAQNGKQGLITSIVGNTITWETTSGGTSALSAGPANGVTFTVRPVQAWAWNPLVIARPTRTSKSVAIFGDSIGMGASHSAYYAYLERAIEGAGGTFINLSCSGERLVDWTAGHTNRAAIAALADARTWIMGHLVNDMYANNADLATMKTRLLAYAAAARSAAGTGVQLLYITGTPLPSRAQATDVAAYMRDTGPTGFLAEAGDNADGVIETMTYFEASADSNTFASGYDSGDGVHPSTTAHNTVGANTAFIDQITPFLAEGDPNVIQTITPATVTVTGTGLKTLLTITRDNKGGQLALYTGTETAGGGFKPSLQISVDGTNYVDYLGKSTLAKSRLARTGDDDADQLVDDSDATPAQYIVNDVPESVAYVRLVGELVDDSDSLVITSGGTC
jgi:hypothetical protein